MNRATVHYMGGPAARLTVQRSSILISISGLRRGQTVHGSLCRRAFCGSHTEIVSVALSRESIALHNATQLMNGAGML